jgi:hypothetical protein
MGFTSIFTKDGDRRYEIMKNPVTPVAPTVGCARAKKGEGFSVNACRCTRLNQQPLKRRTSYGSSQLGADWP